MKLETLKIRKRKYFWCAIVVGVVLLITIVLTTSMAKYQTVESIKIAEGTINYSLGDLNVMAIYLNGDNGYEQVGSIPESGYVLNTTESYCNIGDAKQDVTINYDFDTKAFSVSPYTQGKMKCYLYFDLYNPTASDLILANSSEGTGTPDFSKTSCTSGCDEATVGLYSAEDDDGTSYYFRGDVTDNYVYFAGYYWRIIRINGDGTIRMIYDGTTARSNGTYSTDTQPSKSAFNSEYTDNMYVGFMYTSNSVHGLGTSSVIKNELETWYKSALKSYTDYISYDAGFCGDRTPYKSSDGSTSGGGTGTTTTYYGAYIRLKTNKSPSFKCGDTSDLYTANNSNKGNKALTNPIGLITADEVAYAGGVYASGNSNYYLYTGQDYWTMTPFGWGTNIAGVAYVLIVDSELGWLYETNVYNPYGIRPVINLKSDTAFADGGTGTISNPYVVQT